MISRAVAAGRRFTGRMSAGHPGRAVRPHLVLPEPRRPARLPVRVQPDPDPPPPARTTTVCSAKALPVLFFLEFLSDIGLRPIVGRSPNGESPEFLGTAWSIVVGRGAILSLAVVGARLPVADRLRRVRDRAGVARPGRPTVPLVVPEPDAVRPVPPPRLPAVVRPRRYANARLRAGDDPAGVGSGERLGPGPGDARRGPVPDRHVARPVPAGPGVPLAPPVRHRVLALRPVDLPEHPRLRGLAVLRPADRGPCPDRRGVRAGTPWRGTWPRGWTT